MQSANHLSKSPVLDLKISPPFSMVAWLKDQKSIDVKKFTTKLNEAKTEEAKRQAILTVDPLTKENTLHRILKMNSSQVPGIVNEMLKLFKESIPDLFQLLVTKDSDGIPALFYNYISSRRYNLSVFFDFMVLFGEEQKRKIVELHTSHDSSLLMILAKYSDEKHLASYQQVFGLDVMREGFFTEDSKDFFTPFHYACASQKANSMIVWLAKNCFNESEFKQNKADAEITRKILWRRTNSGDNPLHFYFSNRLYDAYSSEKMIDTLKEMMGADLFQEKIKELNALGMNPLHYAIGRNQLLVRSLLKNIDQKTASEIIFQKNHENQSPYDMDEDDLQSKITLRKMYLEVRDMHPLLVSPETDKEYQLVVNDFSLCLRHLQKNVLIPSLSGEEEKKLRKEYKRLRNQLSHVSPNELYAFMDLLEKNELSNSPSLQMKRIYQKSLLPPAFASSSYDPTPPLRDIFFELKKVPSDEKAIDVFVDFYKSLKDFELKEGKRVPRQHTPAFFKVESSARQELKKGVSSQEISDFLTFVVSESKTCPVARLIVQKIKPPSSTMVLSKS